jgi:hypothetical protein
MSDGTEALAAACREVIIALDGAAKAWERTNAAERYEREWLAELGRRKRAERLPSLLAQSDVIYGLGTRDEDGRGLR